MNIQFSKVYMKFQRHTDNMIEVDKVDIGYNVSSVLQYVKRCGVCTVHDVSDKL